MNDIRTQIQTKLSAITTIQCGAYIPDGIIEDGTTYFGYSLQEDYVSSDQDKDYTMQLSINGYLIRKENKRENTLAIIDTALESIKTALKELNFKYSYNDVTLDSGIRKIAVRGVVEYNELNKELIL